MEDWNVVEKVWRTQAENLLDLKKEMERAPVFSWIWENRNPLSLIYD